MRQSVQQRRREMFLPHHGIPIAKFEVGGNDDRTAFIERRAELEEEVGPIATERDEAEFIQDQEIVLTDPSHEAREFQLMLSGKQVVDQTRDIVKADALALPAGG